jgi:hypothetical protein
MNSVTFLAVLSLAAFSFQPAAPDVGTARLAPHAQTETRKAKKSTASDPAEQLTAGTGVWNLKNYVATNAVEEKVRTYTFKSNHEVIEEKTTGASITEKWSIQTMGDDTQLRIGSELYQLYFKIEGGTTEMRLGKLANSKAEPSTFIDYKLSKHREY